MPPHMLLELVYLLNLTDVSVDRFDQFCQPQDNGAFPGANFVNLAAILTTQGRSGNFQSGHRVEI